MSISMKIKYIKQERGYWYYRRSSVRKRLRGQPGEPDFMVDYAQAHASYGQEVVVSAPRADHIIVAGTVRELVVAYLGSPEYLNLAPQSRVAYRRYADMTCQIFKNVAAMDVKMKDILKVRNKLASTPGKANEFCKVVRVIFGWGIPLEMVDRNPADFRGTQIKNFKIGEHKAWPEDVLEDFLAKTTGPIRQVMMMCLYTGQRIGDVLAIQHSQRKGDVLDLTQQKTGKELHIPLHPDLKVMLDGMGQTSLTHILTTVSGKPWGYQNWRKRLELECARLGVEGYTSHGLRKNAVCRLLLCGCTTQETGSITGQTDDTVAYYAKSINQMKLAQTAMNRYASWTKAEQSDNKTVVNFAAQSGEK